jgi:N-acetylglutamate synthase-like GNAT family acetyltransferase
MSAALADLQIKPLALVPEFFNQIAAWHHQECERQGLKSSFELRKQRLQLHIQTRPVPQTLVAVKHDLVVGCVSVVNYTFRSDSEVLSPRHASLHETPLWLSSLFVSEYWREQGIGSALITAAMSYARTLGVKELWLSAAEFTEFYQKREWVVTRRTRLGGRKVNIMQRSL